MPLTVPCAAVAFVISLSVDPTPNPHTVVAAAIEAMGGTARLAALTAYRLDGIGHDYILGNAERAEGPWRTQYAAFSELWDVAGSRMRRTATNPIAPPGAAGAQLVSIFADSVLGMQMATRSGPGYGGAYEDLRNRSEASPARVLTQASAAPSLRWERVVNRFGVMHDVVAFNTPEGIDRIEIARNSHLPDAVELVRHATLEIRRAMFGDATMRFEYLDWTSQPDGLWWPMQHRILFNGDMMSDMTFSKITPLASAPVDSFVISDSIRRAFATSVSNSPTHFRLGTRPEPVQPGDDVVRLADNWAMTLVKQADGVVVFEAHLSDQYIKQVVAEVHRRWPGAPIKAFVLTSDPWAHLGGLREVVAMGIPIYVNGASIPFLRSIVASPFTIDPDDLARAKKPAQFIAVNQRTVIGAGKNRLELYPVGGAYSERMTMAYFPDRHLLYGADLLFPDRNVPAGAPRTFSRTPAVELQRAVARERLVVDSVFCVQASYPIFAWKDIRPTGS